MLPVAVIFFEFEVLKLERYFRDEGEESKLQ
jgi:hypothetical protein